MPSLPELHHDVAVSADTQSLPTAGVAPADVLAKVKTEGLRRRTRRHRRNSVLAALALAVVAVPVVTLLPGEGSPEEVRVASAPDAGTTEGDADEADAPATTVVEAPPTTVLDPDTPVESPLPPDAPPVSLGPATVIERPAGPTCLNSTDPACGDFRWDPQPAPNQPIEGGFTEAPATAVVGETVTFAVEWADPDAAYVADYFSTDGVGLGIACTQEVRRFGAWTPPAAAPDSGVLVYSHAFDAPGTYEVIVSIQTAADASSTCDDPYASVANLSHTITVAAPTP